MQKPLTFLSSLALAAAVALPVAAQDEPRRFIATSKVASGAIMSMASTLSASGTYAMPAVASPSGYFAHATT